MNEWSFFFVQMVGTNLGKCEWVWEEILRWLNPRWQNSRWQNSRWLPSSCCVILNEWTFFVQNGWIQEAELKMAAMFKLSENEWVNYFCSKWLNPRGRIQNGWHLQGEWEWMSLSQIELVWVRVLCKMAESRRAEFKMTVFKMAAIIKLGKNEWVWVRLN